jgi:Peptidase U49
VPSLKIGCHLCLVNRVEAANGRRNSNGKSAIAFVGVAPERAQELEGFWRRYDSVVKVVSDSEYGHIPVMEAGAYRYLHFNHRMLRVIWLLSFSAWEGYVMIYNGATTGNLGDAAERFKDSLQTAIAVCTAGDPLSVRFPQGIPEPGPTDALPAGSAKAAGEIATFSVGWAFLHEVKHLMHQQEGTSGGDDSEACHKEELSCDAFATQFLLERAGDYARDNRFSKEKVLFKRQLGIYFVLYAIAVVGREKWGGTKTHPAIQQRVDQTLAIMNKTGFSKGAAVVASASFAALQTVLRNVPSPIMAIAAQATAERWTENSFADIGLRFGALDPQLGQKD